MRELVGEQRKERSVTSVVETTSVRRLLIPLGVAVVAVSVLLAVESGLGEH